MELTTKRLHYQLNLFWPRKDKEGCLKTEDVAACQKCYSHSAHNKGCNNSNLLSHLKRIAQLYMGLLSWSDSIL